MSRQSPPSEQALQGLADYRAAVSAAKRRDIDKAIRYLRRTGATINVATVAARAGVQRKTVYKHPDLIVVIDQYRREPAANRPAATVPKTASSPPYGNGSPPKTTKSKRCEHNWPNTKPRSKCSTANSTNKFERIPPIPLTSHWQGHSIYNRRIGGKTLHEWAVQ